MWHLSEIWWNSHYIFLQHYCMQSKCTLIWYIFLFTNVCKMMGLFQMLQLTQHAVLLYVRSYILTKINNDYQNQWLDYTHKCTFYSYCVHCSYYPSLECLLHLLDFLCCKVSLSHVQFIVNSTRLLLSLHNRLWYEQVIKCWWHSVCTSFLTGWWHIKGLTIPQTRQINSWSSRCPLIGLLK